MTRFKRHMDKKWCWTDRLSGPCIISINMRTIGFLHKDQYHRLYGCSYCNVSIVFIFNDIEVNNKTLTLFKSKNSENLEKSIDNLYRAVLPS